MFCVGFDNLRAVSTVSMAFHFLGFHTVQLGRRLLNFGCSRIALKSLYQTTQQKVPQDSTLLYDLCLTAPSHILPFMRNMYIHIMKKIFEIKLVNNARIPLHFNYLKSKTF
jgi:hypothetical protein